MDDPLSPFQLGEKGEALAARFLTQSGYRVVDRNYRTKRGEIDLIAYDGNTLVFIEVKSRRGNRFGAPHWSVDQKKQVRLWRSAEQYLLKNRLGHLSCRFDLVCIQSSAGGLPAIELLKNAFEKGGPS